MADRRSWLWRRRSSEKGVSGSDTSGSPVSSPRSDRCSDEQEAVKCTSKIDFVPHCLPSEVPLLVKEDEDQETLKCLREKLSAALSHINAKEELVKQHAKVAEEAVAGWEQAEIEAANIKQQLEAASKKNSVLEAQVSHLDGALKECVRQLRQSREEQEDRIHDALVKRLSQWEFEKSKLENQILDLQKQLEADRTDACATRQIDLQARLQTADEENRDLEVELLARSKDLEILKLERDLSNQAAEAASKQHLESVKKIKMMEAECFRLHNLTRQNLPGNSLKRQSNAASVESLTDSQLDCGENKLITGNEVTKTESWASALIAELDQFKSGKSDAQNIFCDSAEIGLMDDFLEMELLAALPEGEHASSNIDKEIDSDHLAPRDNVAKSEVEYSHGEIANLQSKLEKVEAEKDILGQALTESKNQLEILCEGLMLAQDNIAELQKQLDIVSEAKSTADQDVNRLEGMQSESLRKLESALMEVTELRDAVTGFKEQVSRERALSDEYRAKAEAAEATKVSLEAQLQSVILESECLQETLKVLEVKVEKESALSLELSSKLEAAEASKGSLVLEISKLKETVVFLEAEAVKERASSAESAARAADADELRKALEVELESNSSHVRMLREKIASLEVKIETERELAAEFAARVESAESSRCAAEHKLEAANLEIVKLSNELNSVQGKAEEEKLLSEEYAAKCRMLESQLSGDNRLRHHMSSNGELKIKQEKELAAAAGKLADCQKTIASLGRQLKALADLDDFALDELTTPEICCQSVQGYRDFDADPQHCHYVDSCGFAARSNGDVGPGYLSFTAASSPTVFTGLSSLSYSGYTEK